MIVTLDAKRRLSVPVALAPARPGDQFDAVFDAEDHSAFNASTGSTDDAGRAGK